MKPFGIGSNFDDLKANNVISTYQRENVWHPYYEQNVDEMDFKEKMIAAAEEKKMTNLGGVAIQELQKQLMQHDEDVRTAEDAGKRAELGITKNKNFNFKDKIAELKKREEEDANIQVIDPFTVKVRRITQEITEDDLFTAMSKFGEISRVKIPTHEDTGATKGIGFVTFKRPEDTTAALEDGHIKFEFFELPIEAATISKQRAEMLQSRGRDRPDRGDRGERGERRFGGEGDNKWRD
mmetsp:Transcript_17685/g.29893  ORF Transcript_17685/g.29893 Transcript_17685/m.29893 type:complete len:238 (-) Transcript_17685:49-762(-)